MRLRTALNDYKRGGDAEASTGAFSGHGDRLVHVAPSGSVRDYSSAISGLYGIDRSRFGIETPRRTVWLDEVETVRQHYYRETTLIETEYDAGEFTVHQYDLTLGRAHLTHVELRGAVPPNASLLAFLTLAPEGRETQVGRLVHPEKGPDDGTVVEVFHHDEHDYVSATTGLASVRGQVPETFPELVADDPVEFPREKARERYEDTHLSGDVVVQAPLEREGRGLRTTIVTQLSDHGDIDRETAIRDLQSCTERFQSAQDIKAAARDRTEITVPEDIARERVVQSDLRALDLLRAPSGGRIAAPEFDPFYRNSGGYGYTWFRDDARISQSLLTATAELGLAVDDELVESAQLYCRTQLPDGTWPHRVWARDGSLAPGWAHAHVEGDDDSLEYQADQTATVAAFLAALLRERRDLLSPEITSEIRETIEAAVGAMERHLDDGGLPGPCQNLWEDMVGQFTHTAATYLEAFATVAGAPVADDLRERARSGAAAVADGLDRLWEDATRTYALRLTDGGLDLRLDAATFALVDAFAAYTALDGVEVDAETAERLTDHVGACLDELYRNPAGEPVAGLIRYEGDTWRTDGQDGEKIWGLTTAMGAAAAARLGALLEANGRDGTAFFERAAGLYGLLEHDGPLVTDLGYLPEQLYDDGRADSGTPLGFAHGYRLQATAILAAHDALPSAAPSPSGPPDRPRWTTGEKFGVGTVADHRTADSSRVWFTLTAGALTEVRFPRVDLMNLRTVDFIVSCRTDDYTVRTHVEGASRAEGSVERWVEPTAEDALCFRHVVTETGDGQGHEWRLTVEYAADPDHDAVVADVEFEARDGKQYDLFAAADVALANSGTQDRGLRLGQPGRYHLAARDASAYTGSSTEPRLVDEDGEGYSVALAMVAADRFDWATVGTSGSQPISELFADGRRPEPRESISNESVVLVGQLGAGERLSETLALGFARQADTAAALGEAEGALAAGYDAVRDGYVESWQSFIEDRPLPESVASDPELTAQYRTALMTLLAVEDKTFLGGSIASPSVPWGEAVTAEEPKGYGYNFVWARDLYQVFTAFELVDDLDTAVTQLEYIYRYQQDENGFIPQNTYLNGNTRWGGEQMDNISLPQVMAARLLERGYGFADVAYDYEHVRRSADYVVRNGPATGQERWEEESGYSPSTIAAEIAGLAAAAQIALETDRDADALVWLSLADRWANMVENWTATHTGTDRHTRTPYFVRITRDGNPETGFRRRLANGGPQLDERDIIDAGFLELVRLGVVPWDDETVRNSVAEVDDTIRVDLPAGAAFYRYNGDSYGERDRENSGAPWAIENSGKGRLWPLLTGERGEYELLADADEDALEPTELLRTMQRFANSGRMIAEQVWDREYSTEYDWEYGEGTGSATPLAWAMAQFIRLAHGIDEGRPAETPAFVRERYSENGRHDPDRSPGLHVDTSFEGNQVVVTGETTAAVVAIKTPTDTALVEPDDGAFEERLAIQYGENDILVAAAAERDIESAGTTVRRLTV
ncbi:glycoside hydrolase family 15 protein [Haloarcula sp. GH36]|uniref:glycoside hydrolase family 15 protein n=1 Tax=Haloarcula montana TaxID=3111776 RepID=UPI002D76AEC3|nr:glycoside hydrolase family 15 protein [Haloarcula sp. GH36]